MQVLNLLRGALREARGSKGRTLFLGACIALGVAAVTGVASLVEAVEAGVRAKSRELLAADLRVRSRRPLSEELEPRFAELLPGWQRADLQELATMVAAFEEDAAGSRLCELKSIRGGYPLRGELVTDPPGLRPGELEPDEAIVAPELLDALDLSVGDALRIGGERFEIVGTVSDEPDRLDFALTIGPRIFTSLEGLERTALIGFGSRVRYAALFADAGDPTKPELERLERILEDGPGSESVGVDIHTDAQPRVRRSLDQLERYLGLAALISLVLGGTGVAELVRVSLAERIRGVAVLRTMGWRSREVAALLATHAAGLACIAGLVGAVLGAAIPYIARTIAPDLVPPEVPLPAPWMPAARGILLGVGVALFFAILPLTAIWRVSPALVLRAEAAPLPVPRMVRISAVTLLVGALLAAAWIQADDLELALGFTGGMAGTALILFLGARLAIRAVASLPRERLAPTVRNGLASLARPGQGTVGGIVALGLGVLAIATIALVEDALADELGGAIPEDAPSTFYTDIQPDQWPGVRERIEASGASSLDSVPVVMARLSGVEGVSVQELMEGRGARGGRRGRRWVLTREQRLTWWDELPPGNELVAGELWADPEAVEVSLEEGFAEDLGVGLGSELEFDLQGVRVAFVVTSLRKVDWSSFRINFFIAVEPGALEDAPGFRLAAANIPPDVEPQLSATITREYPNVTALPVRPILEKVRGVLARLGTGVSLLGGFTVAAGLVVLAGSAAASAGRRRREAALLKVLGLTRRGVASLLAVEYALLGVVAGTIGGTAAVFGSWGFIEYLGLSAPLAWGALPVCAGVAGALSAAAGLGANGRALRVKPVESLRG